MSYRIQVNNKKFSIRIKSIENNSWLVKVSIWRNGSLRAGTTFTRFSQLPEVKQWAKDLIKDGIKKNEFFVR